MKKTIITLLVVVFTAFSTGCADQKNINGVVYDTYGIFNEKEKKNPDIEYHIVAGNVVWSIILVESIIAPVYFIGFSIYEPIGVKPENAVKGQVGYTN